MGVRRNFSRGIEILLIFFRLLTMQCKWTFTKRFTPSTPQRKSPMLRQQSQNMGFVGSIGSFSLMLLFTQYKTTWLNVINSHCLAALPATVVCVQQSHATTRLLPGLPGPYGQKIPNCISKNSKEPQKNRQTSWYRLTAVSFGSPGWVTAKIECCYETKIRIIANE